MSLRPTPHLLKPISLEVERKFASLTVPSLTRHSGIPPFQSIRQLPIKIIHDKYFDTASRTLTSAGTWVRLRNGAWEAKVRRGGDFLNSRFEELSGKEIIGEHVQRTMGAGLDKVSHQGADKDEAFGLVKMAEFTTTRETWLADDEFRIMRDRMDFGHEVGEVELSTVLDGKGTTEGPSEEEKQARMQEMDERIIEFMKRYAWAFAEGKPMGKLTAYFEMVMKLGGERSS